MAAEDGITESEIKISNSQVEGTQESTGNNDARVCVFFFSFLNNSPDVTHKKDLHQCLGL